MRLDALQSRAGTAERLLAEARQNLIARTEEVRAFDRKSVEATIARNNAEKRLSADRDRRMKRANVRSRISSRRARRSPNATAR